LQTTVAVLSMYRPHVGVLFKALQIVAWSKKMCPFNGDTGQVKVDGQDIANLRI